MINGRTDAQRDASGVRKAPEPDALDHMGCRRRCATGIAYLVSDAEVLVEETLAELRDGCVELWPELRKVRHGLVHEKTRCGSRQISRVKVSAEAHPVAEVL